MGKKTVASTNVRIGLDLRGFTKGLKRASTGLANFGASAKRLGAGISRNVTLPFAAAAAAGVRSATMLESSFLKIENLVGVTGNTLELFKRGVKDLSSETAKSQQELSEALFTVTSAGIRGAEAMDVLEMAAKASTLGLGETREVAHALTGVLQAYSKQGLEAAEATDVLTAIVREGNLEASELAPTLGRVVGIAAQVGVSFQEVGANIATFTRLGVPAAEAVTGLRGVLNTILNPTKEAERVLATLGITATDLKTRVGEEGLQNTLQFLLESFEGNDRAISTLFGNVRALGNVLGTAGAQGETYKGVLDSIQNSTGLVDKGFENVSQGSGFKFKKVLTELQNSAIELGITLLPMVTKIADFVTKSIQTFQSLSSETKTVLLTVVAAVAAAGPIMSAVGVISGALAALLTPTGLILVAIAGLIFVLVKFWDQAKPIFVKIANAWIDLYNESMYFRGAIQGVAFVFKSFYDIARVILDNFLGALKALGKTLLGVFSLDWDLFTEGLSDAKNVVLGAVADMSDKVKENWDEMMANMNPREKVELVTEEGLQTAVNNVLDPVKAMWEKAKGFLSWKSTGGGGTDDTPADVIDKTGTAAEVATPKVNKFALAWKNLKSNVDLTNMAIQELGGSIQSVFEEMLEGTDRTFKELANSVVSSLQKMIIKLLAAAAAAAVLVVLLSAAGLGGLTMNTLKTFKSFAGAFKSMFSSLSGVALANGGLAFGETLAVVGDNPNARMDPEVIAPLSKLRSMMGDMGVGGGTVTVVGRISGQDILLSSEKADRTRSRYRGF